MRFRVRGVMLGMLASILEWFAVGAEPSRATIGVRFEIQAPAYAMNLGARKASREAETAIVIADHCRQHLTYLEWRPLTNGPAAGDPPWVLKVTMAAEGGAPIPEVVLRWEKVLNGTTQTMGLQHSLYAANDLTQPAQDERRLRADLAQRLGALLSNEQVLALVQERFLAGIPVLRRLVADPVNQRFLLPAFWNELLPGEGSVFRAQYRSRRSPTEVVPVRLKLGPSEEWSGQVGCRVREFHFPPIDMDTPGWMPVMVESLSNAVPDSVFIFMEKYVKDHTYGSTTNGLVTDPFGGAGVGGTM